MSSCHDVNYEDLNMFFANQKSFEKISCDILTDLINQYNDLTSQLEIAPVKIPQWLENEKMKYTKTFLMFADSIHNEEQSRALHHLFLRITLRVAQFESDYINKPEERLSITRQYQDFSKLLHNCLTRNNSDQLIKNYLNKATYYAVGCTELVPKDRINTIVSWSAIGIGLSLIAIACSFAFVSPLVPIAIPVALMIMAPAIANLLTPQNYNTEEVKEAEETIFKDAQNLLNEPEANLPDDQFEEEPEAISDYPLLEI